MKKSKSVFILSGVILIFIAAVAFFSYNVYNSGLKKTDTDGFVLMKSLVFSDGGEMSSEGSVQQLFFDGGTQIKPVYPKKVKFKNSDDSYSTINRASFIYYSDGSLSSFADGVIMRLDGDDSLQSTYYDVPANAVMQKTEKGYVIDSGGTPISFTRFIWKISDEKYLIVDESGINVRLSSDVSKVFDNFVEVCYVNDNVAEFSSVDGIWYSISDNCLSNLGDDAVINLAQKEVSFTGREETIPLEAMVINATGNTKISDNSSVGIIPKFKITTIDGEDGESGQQGELGETGEKGEIGAAGEKGIEGITGENGENGEQGETGSDGKKGTGGNDGGSGSPGASGPAGVNGLQGGTAGGGGEGGTPGNATNIPKVEISSWTVTPESVEGEIRITDEDSLLASDVVLCLRKGANTTVIDSITIPNGSMLENFAFEGLESGCEYRLTASAKYAIGAKTYEREFLNKVFVTDGFGLTLSKRYSRLDSLAFRLSKESYSSVSSVTVELYDKTKTSLIKTANVILGDSDEDVIFSGLEKDTEYNAILKNLTYTVGGNTSAISSYGDYLTAKTLKEIPDIGNLLAVVNKKNGTFETQLSNAALLTADKGFSGFEYNLYDVDTGSVVKTITTNTSESIAFIVDGVQIERSHNYYIEVSATFFDNDKNVSLKAKSNVVTMTGTGFPTVGFTASKVMHESIQGTLSIECMQSKLTVDESKPLLVVYTNSTGDSQTLRYTNIDAWKTGTTVNIPINLTGLKKKESYTLSVWGYVDLNDSNGERHLLIGSAVVDTINPTPIRAALSVNGSDSKNAISINASLLYNTMPGDNEHEMKTSHNMRVNLYAGSDTTSAPIAYFNVTDKNSNIYQSDIKDKYYDSGTPVSITEADFGLLPQQLTATSYTIEFASLTDYTPYENQIPIINNTVTLNKTESAPPLPDINDAIDVKKIINSALPDYGLVQKPEYKPDTAMGIRAKAKHENGNKKAVTVTYHIFDAEAYDSGDINEITSVKLDVLQSGQYAGTIPVLNIIFKDGVNTRDENYWNDKNTEYTAFSDNLTYSGPITELTRGRDYYITYTAELKLSSAQDVYYQYPEDHTSGIVLRSKKVETPFETPKFLLYPFDSSDSAATWQQFVTDPDGTLNGDSKRYIVVPTGGATTYSSITTGSSVYTPVSFTGLRDGIYSVFAKWSTYLYPGRSAESELHKYYFNSNKEYRPSGNVYSVTNEPDKSRLKIVLTESEVNIKKLAGFMITAYDSADASKTVTKIINFQQLTISGASSVAVAYLNYAEISALSGKNIRIEVSALADEGNGSGYTLADGTQLFAIKQMSVNAENNYKIVTNSNFNLAVSDSANGSVFNGTLAGSLTGGWGQLNYSSPLVSGSGVMNFTIDSRGTKISGTNEYVNLRSLKPRLINCDKFDGTTVGGPSFSFPLGAITPTVNLMGREGWNIINRVEGADISFVLSGHQNGVIKDGKVYIELYDKDKNKLEGYSDIAIPVTPSATSYKASITGLQNSQKYFFKLYANLDNGGSTVKTYLYDIYYETNSGVYYPINTLSEFDTEIQSIIYEANDYNDKALTVNYTLGETVGYRLMFNIYKVTTSGNTENRTLWLDNTALVTYGLIPEYSTYSGSMKTPIKWNPSQYSELSRSMLPNTNPIVADGSTYEIQIAAMALDESGNYTIELSRAAKRITLNELRAPIFGTTIRPSIDKNGNHILDYTVTAIDSDKSMVNGEFRVKFFDSDGRDITPAAYKVGADYSPKVYSLGSPCYFELSPDTLPAGVTLRENSSYTIKFYSVLDSLNTGEDGEGNTLTSIKDYSYEELTNAVYQVSETTLDSSGVKIGNVSIKGMTNNPAGMQLVFNGSIGLSSIDEIQYTVYSESGQTTFPLVKESFVPVKNTSPSGDYYTFNLSKVSLSSKDTYNVIIHYYSGGVRISKSQLVYNYF